MPPAQKKGKGADPEPVAQSGKLWFPNGDRYEGEYVAEGTVRRRQGRGVYTAFCSALLEDESCPEAVRQLPPAPQPPLEPHDIVQWSGAWEADAFKEGQVTFADGSVYQGSFGPQGQFVSGGRYTWPNGCWYEGDWCENMIHGSGKFCGLNGQVLEGIYRNNAGPGLEDVQPGSPRGMDGPGASEELERAGGPGGRAVDLGRESDVGDLGDFGDVED